jgi:hypothetical protein
LPVSPSRQYRGQELNLLSPVYETGELPFLFPDACIVVNG